MIENLVGRHLGPYRVDARIGRGGMAFVYKAYQASMNRYVALKVLPREPANDPQQSERFRKEAQTIANLEHPHILPVYDFGETDLYTYIVMRLVETGTLYQRLHGVPLSLLEIRDVMADVSEALDYAHSRDVIHRDIKPSNILIDDRGNCLLADFGISKILAVSSGYRSTGTMGTPDYMSPEQGIGEKLDTRSDIYSLGVVLYEMATGRVPFHADTPVATVYQHIHKPLPHPHDYNPRLPDAVVQVIAKALAKDPNDRYPTALDMVLALKAAVASSTESKKPRVTQAPVTKSPTAAPGPTETSTIAPPPEDSAAGQGLLADQLDESRHVEAPGLHMPEVKAKAADLPAGAQENRLWVKVQDEAASRRRLEKMWEEETSRREAEALERKKQQRQEVRFMVSVMILLVLLIVVMIAVSIILAVRS